MSIEAATVRAASVAFVLALALTPVAMAGLRRFQVLDVPNARSSHERATVRGAGLALLLATTAAAVTFAPRSLELFVLVGVSVGLGIVGGLDDLSPLAPNVRLGAQAGLAAIGAVLLSQAGLAPTWSAVLGGVGVLAVMAYVNAFNFMDGINGISGTQAAIVGAAFVGLGVAHEDTLVAVGGATLAGAALGFLPFNFPTARAFLGDIGSYFMGAWLSLLAVRALAVGIDPVAVALPFAVYLGDTGVTLLRRAARREPLFEAHREHVYQRLVRSGWSHTRTTIFVSAITVMCAIAGVTVAGSSGTASALAAAGAGIAVASYLRSAPADPERHHAEAPA